jgi:NADPH-dependent FMN reductase
VTRTLTESAAHATGGVLDVVALPGSRRSGSFNRALLDTAVELAPAGMAVEVHELGALPLYEADLDDHAGAPGPAPEPVAALRQRVRRAVPRSSHPARAACTARRRH